jgi:hypothetical protein
MFEAPLEIIDSALRLSSGDRNPLLPIALPGAAPGAIVLGLMLPDSLRASVIVPKVRPLSVRRIVIGRTRPLDVLTTGATTTFTLDTGSMNRLLTTAILVLTNGRFSTTVPVTTTVVVKSRQMKKPGNRCPYHQVG